MIDLTHVITPNIPTWGMFCGFSLTTDYDYANDTQTTSFKVQSMSLVCGIGTHMDAPAHCIKGAATIEDLPLSQMINPGYMIDLTHRFDADNCLTAKDILEFEAQHSPQWQDSCVLINTGWHRLWDTPASYHNAHRFPYIENVAAQMLVDRGIRILGIDTLSPDRPESGYPVHKICLSNGILIVENVGNLAALPHSGFMVYTIPINIENATESPIRMWVSY